MLRFYNLSCVPPIFPSFPTRPLPISVVISQAIRDNGGGRLVSVDPFQTAPDGYAGKGVRSLEAAGLRSEEHTSELQSRFDIVCRLLLEKKQTHRVSLLTTHYHSHTPC